VGTKIGHALAQFLEQVSDSFLVLKSSVIGADGNFHEINFCDLICHARRTRQPVITPIAIKKYSQNQGELL